MSRRGLIIALFVSVAINLFALGVGAGGLLMAARMHDMHSRGARPGPMLWAAGDELPPGQRREFRRLLREEGQGLRPSLREARQLRRQAWASLGREPFDAAGARATLDRARALELESRGKVESRILDFAGQLGPEERGKLAEGLARAPGPGPEPRGGMRRMHDGPPPRGEP